MAELIAQLDGPIYVERVALFDAKQRTRAKKAIKKALQLQVENRGFAFVEVLAECPTHLGLTPRGGRAVGARDDVAVFPLGVKKDVDRPSRCPLPGSPASTPSSCSTSSARAASRRRASARASRRHSARDDIGSSSPGAGGDGAQTAAMLLTHAAINEGFDATHIPSYGPESRGGTSYADVRIAEGEVLSPAAPNPHVLVAFNAPSLAKFGPDGAAGRRA